MFADVFFLTKTTVGVDKIDYKAVYNKYIE